MTMDGPLDVDSPQIPDVFVEAWAAVFLDVYEKLKERGELPDDQGDSDEKGDS